MNLNVWCELYQALKNPKRSRTDFDRRCPSYEVLAVILNEVKELYCSTKRDSSIALRRCPVLSLRRIIEVMTKTKFIITLVTVQKSQFFI
jgi:hypothetical protein